MADPLAPASTSTPGAKPATKRKIDYEQAATDLADRILERARADGARKLRDRQDWWNLKLYRGGSHQWDIWDPNAQRYVARGTDPARGGIPAYVPRAVTNVFADAIDGIAAILDQTSPAKECAGSTDDASDQAAAEVAEAAIPVLFDEIGYVADRAQIHMLIALTGEVAYSVYYDDDPKYGTDDITALQCADPACAQYAMPADVEATDFKCPDCGGEMQDALDPKTQMPITAPFNRGRMCAKVSHSFEVSKPPGCRTKDTRRMPYVLTHTRLPRETIIARWPKTKDKLERQGGASPKNDVTGSAYADAITGLVAPMGDDSRAPSTPVGPVVYELWHDPIDDDEFYFPEGLYRVWVDGAVATSGPLEYKDLDGRPFKNVLIRTFRQSPGVATGKPPADDLAPLQVQRNIVESLYDLSLMHFAAPKEYIPMSVTLLDKPTGAPGERIRMRSTIPGEVPVVVEGRSPASGLMERIRAIDEKIQQLSKLNAVLAGQRPEGDPTLGEIQILQERGMSAFRAPLDELIQFEIDLARMVLTIARETMWTPRFYKVEGENGAWEVKQFLGADLAGAIDVTIDKASAWPRSPLMESLHLKQGMEMGLLPSPVSQDPELAGKLYAMLNLARLKPSLGTDRKQVTRAIDKWKAAQTPQDIAPPDPLTMNLPLHFAYKQAWLKTEEAEALAVDRAEVYNAMRAHLQQIQQLMAPPPAPAEPAGGAGPNGDTLSHLVRGGVLKPAGGPPASPMGDLVKRGVLRPAAPAPTAPTGGTPGASSATR